MNSPTSRAERRRSSRLRRRLGARPASLLAISLVCIVWPMTRPAVAQTSTPIYGSDTTLIGNVIPTPRLGAESTPTYGNGSDPNGDLGPFNSITLGRSGSPTPNLGLDSVITYGTLYDPNLVDVAQGFVSRATVELLDSDGVCFVVKNPATADYVKDGFLGTFQLPSSLHVDVVRVTAANGDYSHIHGSTGFKIYVQMVSPSGATTNLGVTDVITLSNDSQQFQIRYLPKFQTLDVYCGSSLKLRATGVNLKGSGIVKVDNSQPGGEVDQAAMGWVSATRRIGNDVSVLNFWSVGNNLVFGQGLGPNSYEDRFPFLTQRQSVWNSPDTVKFTKSLEATGTWDKKAKQVGFNDPLGDSIFSIQPGAFARNYDFGLSLEMDATGGTADISYPVFLDMALPAQYSADPGQSFQVPILFYPDPAATLATTSPGANVTSDLIYGGEFGFSLNTSVFGQTLSSGNVLDVKIPKNDIKIFDLNEILASGLIPNVNGGVNYAGYVQGTEGATGKKNPTEHGTKGQGSTEGAKDGTSIASYVQVNVTYPPDLSTSGYVNLGTTNAVELTSTADSPLVTLSSDFTNDILGEIPGLDILPQIPFFNNDYSLNLGGYPVELGFHIADLYGSVDLGAHVDYDFKPQPQVWLLLSDPNDPNKTATLGPFAFDPATNRVATPPTVHLPANGDPLTITPVLTLSSSAYPDGQPDFKTTSGNKFKTNGQLTIGGSLAFNPFEFSYQFGDNSFNSSTALGLPFPFKLAGSVPVVTYPLDPFEIGNQNGGAAGAVPFQRTLKGKSFTLYPKASHNPVLDAVSPATAKLEDSGTNGSLPITLTTENASGGGLVIWDYNGDPTAPQPATLPYNRQSASLVTSAIPNVLLSSLGLHTITFINQDGSGSSYPSNSVSFVVTAPAPGFFGFHALTADGQQPYTVIAGGDGFVLQVDGASFLPPHMGSGGALDYVGSVVLWNGQPLLTTYVNGGRLLAKVPSNLVPTTATALISVSTAGPGGGTSGTRPLTPINPLPILTSLSQPGSQPGSSGLTLDLNGSGFTPGSVVRWNDGTTTVTKALTYGSPNHLTLALGVSDLSTPGVRTVQVQNPTPGGGLSAIQTFTVGQYPAGGGVILVPALLRTANGIQVQLTIVNTSQTADATSTIIQSATAQPAGKAAVSPLLPSPAQAMLVGTVPAGGSVTLGTVPAGQSVPLGQVYVFPSSLGTPGQAVLLSVSGSSSGKAFTSRLRVVLP